MVFRRTMFLFLLQHFFIIPRHALSVNQNHHPLHHSLETDRAALLEFKRTIKSDPNSSLSNWNDSTHVCYFTGVRCNKEHHRVWQLNLNDSGIVGPLSPFISNLTHLRVLELVNNHLSGEIPREFSSLRHLRLLLLEGNAIHGEIPDTFSLLVNLSMVDLRLNHLTGKIPPSFSNCTSLKSVDLSFNQLSGEIPREFSSLRHLRRLLLEGNNIHGQIPDTFSHLVNLTVVDLRQNRLTGKIPPYFFSNCTQLKNVDLSFNLLEGNIPEIGNCRSLWNLNLYNNQFTGEIPFSITNATSIDNLDVEYNFLSGELPSKIVESLPDLEFLHLSFNPMISPENNSNLDPFFTALCNYTSVVELELEGMGLGGKLPTSIGKCVYLESLLLEENKITGSIPPTLSNLTYLSQLNLTSNLLSGTIPGEISQLSHLQRLFLSHNSLSGPIPAAVGQFKQLGLLDLSTNKFSGEIPKSIGNLVKINYMFLNNNLLSGSIPSSLLQCRNLYTLDLSYNNLTGNIPPEITGLHEMRIFINLSHNFLGGDLPIELSKLENVQEMDLSSNRFTGRVSPRISSCIALSLLNISHNRLEGELPESLGDLKNLKVLDVSVNHLFGTIPTSLSNIHTLTFLNLSVNEFSGTIPSGGIFDSATNSSFLPNGNLCGSIPVSFSVVCCMIGCRYLKVIISAEKVEMETETETKSQPGLIHNFPRITYKELFDATGGFDEGRKLGSGSYGRVYEGLLPDGMHIAVKVLQLQTGNSTKSFNRECQVLKRIRHRNLIRIITACSLPDFKAIVLPYMANGSLDSWLYPPSGPGVASSSQSSDLSLIQRVNICSDIAEGMAYLHHHSPVRVIHCDLKPSNVLLNDDMTALVSDFGIARLVMTVGGANNGGVAENLGKSTANMLSGSIGYIAPEYGFGTNTDTKGDVYSFGILVLEMVTRKRPIDDMFAGGLSLHKWVKSHYHGRIERVVDSLLVKAMRDQSPEVKKMWEVAIEELTELGILCTQDSPSTRPTMLDAADDLDRLKRYLLGDTTATFASSLGISSSIVGDD
ncbi:putative leucine-rich repeat receptor-like serine/threonine-protein kinase At2g24130 isoform X2 [Rhododendron vialii]|uniref:putative leucine-rich repeat receptor-like serine/threonine-protein kinase At2g24130 isoform X2 n=1 Tax=Rhododendron vialii TaxID=182163 RepID=UPI00266011D3|nr:putative leucine-rich repeat receptor-like serine/threonine-protein kinase At2g24130 isoform X2 [Rhododendron vialii]